MRDIKNTKRVDRCCKSSSNNSKEKNKPVFELTQKLSILPRTDVTNKRINKINRLNISNYN